ncbi:MAG: MFS transporter, partial [Lentisphaeria bacterium]|nr:MFS transporter [Lentisphaeria bacterium]
MEPNQEFPYWKRNLVLAWISQFFVLAGFAAAMTFIPLFFQDHLGIESENERGIYVSMFNFFGVLGYAVFCPLWGSLSDRFGVKIMLLRGSFVTAIFFPMMAFVTAPWQLIT